jgi:hypothetical protein
VSAYVSPLPDAPRPAEPEILDDVPPDVYHADLLHPVPSLSASLAHVLVTRSPLHAWVQHPRLNPDFVATDEAKFDVGTVCHSLLLDHSRQVAIIDADDWRSKAAQAARDESRAAGKTPLLRQQWNSVETLVRAIGDQLGSHHAEPPLLEDGKPERTLVWEEDGVACRARLDWLRDDLAAVDDLKTTGRSARQDEFSRNLYSLGYDLKAAWYLRGVEAVTGERPAFRWIVAETSPPYAVSVVTATPEVLDVGEAKCEYALSLWRECMALDEWPAYIPFVSPAAPPPPWERSRWLDW